MAAYIEHRECCLETSVALLDLPAKLVSPEDHLSRHKVGFEDGHNVFQCTGKIYPICELTCRVKWEGVLTLRGA